MRSLDDDDLDQHFKNDTSSDTGILGGTRTRQRRYCISDARNIKFLRLNPSCVMLALKRNLITDGDDTLQSARPWSERSNMQRT